MINKQNVFTMPIILQISNLDLVGFLLLLAGFTIDLALVG